MNNNKTYNDSYTFHRILCLYLYYIFIYIEAHTHSPYGLVRLPILYYIILPNSV